MFEGDHAAPDGEEAPGAFAPLFSVIIPTFNRANLVTRAINSVLDQDFDSYEILIADDGSTDHTAQAVADLKRERDDLDRMTYLELPRIGAAAAQNRGADRASGKYLIFLDSDDEALPGWLSRMAAAAGTNPALISIDSWSESENRKVRIGQFDLGYAGSGVSGLILSGTFAIQRSWFAELGGFDDKLSSGTKTDLSLKILGHMQRKTMETVHIDEALVYHHRGSPLSVREDDEAVLTGTERILELHSEVFAKQPQVLADYHGVAGVRAARVGEAGRARRHLWKAAKADPTKVKRWLRLIKALFPGGTRSWARSS